MADTTIAGLPNELVAPGGNDWIGIWNLITSRYEKIKRSNLIGATITGGGTIALGGFTLTVPASGTAALLATVNTFTTGQVIAPASTGVEGLVINMPSLTTFQALKINYNGAQRQQAYTDGVTNRYWLLPMDGGAGTGAYFVAGRNNNASTPAAGFVQLENRAGTTYYNWIDASGNLRSGTTAPINTQDSSGTVVGTQTSMAAAKFISDELSPLDEVAARIRAGAKAVRRFTYRSGSYDGEAFEGVVIDAAPAYGMDREPAHPAGKSLNEINIMGDLLRFAAWAMARIEALEAAQRGG